MKREDLLKYEGESVLLKYNNAIGPQSRTGFIKAVTLRSVIFWPMNTEEEIEILIPFADVDDIIGLLYINLD